MVYYFYQYETNLEGTVLSKSSGRFTNRSEGLYVMVRQLLDFVDKTPFSLQMLLRKWQVNEKHQVKSPLPITHLTLTKRSGIGTLPPENNVTQENMFTYSFVNDLVERYLEQAFPGEIHITVLMENEPQDFKQELHFQFSKTKIEELLV